MCKEDFIAGLRKGLELNAAQVEAAWPSEDDKAVYVCEVCEHAIDEVDVRLIFNSFRWLKAQLLENLK